MSAGSENSPDASALTPIFHWGASMFIGVGPEVSICAPDWHAAASAAAQRKIFKFFMEGFIARFGGGNQPKSRPPAVSSRHKTFDKPARAANFRL